MRRRVLLFWVITLAFFVQTFAQVQNLEIIVDGEKKIIPIAVIDSITYEDDGTSFTQIIWNEGHEYRTNISNIEQVSFLTEEATYNNFSAKEYGFENGIINSLGQYAAVGKDTISNNGAVIIVGDINKSEPQITVHIDSLKLVRYVYCDSIIYRYFYGENEFTILMLNESGDSLDCKTFTYNQLQQSYKKSGVATRAGGAISNNGWFKLFSFLDSSISMKDTSTKSLLINWASMQHNPLLSFGGDVFGFIKGDWWTKALILAKWLDAVWCKFVFKGATITTLPHEVLSIDDVKLGCNIKGLQTIPRIRNFEAYALCSMKLRAKSGLSGAKPNLYMKWDVQERDIYSDGEQYFDFQNLLLESQYEYYPQLNLAWTEAEASIWIKVNDDVIPDIEDWKVVTEEHKSFQYLRGEDGEFFTTKPDAITGDVHYIYVDAAVVGCSFANVPDNASCGIEYSDGTQTSSISVDFKDDESFPIIKDLQPSTTYTYRAFVQTKYKRYYGKEKNFTTEMPSCSTGETINRTENSAIVECYYTSVDNKISECGVMISDDNETRKIPTSNTNGKQEISISGLSPATTYNYWAYVEVDGIPVNGEVKSFTTLTPSIVGTWSVVETYETRPSPGAEWQTKTREYTLSLNEDGTMLVSGLNSTDYIDNAGWSYGTNGSFNATGYLIATQTQYVWDKFTGSVDDVKNPQKITGVRYRGNMNQVTIKEEVVGSFVMTRN